MCFPVFSVPHAFSTPFHLLASYTTDGAGVAAVDVELNIGQALFTLRGGKRALDGRCLVAHDSKGDRVACGVLEGSDASAPSRAPSPAPSAGPFEASYPTAPLFAVMGPFPGYASALVLQPASVTVRTARPGTWTGTRVGTR
jgi:hypothetical protein